MCISWNLKFSKISGAFITNAPKGKSQANLSPHTQFPCPHLQFGSSMQLKAGMSKSLLVFSLCHISAQINDFTLVYWPSSIPSQHMMVLGTSTRDMLNANRRMNICVPGQSVYIYMYILPANISTPRWNIIFDLMCLWVAIEGRRVKTKFGLLHQNGSADPHFRVA